jgi:murein DD-endopeptidase MepM/ murein hydrolase activator NlpD
VSKIARENRTTVSNIKRWNGLTNPDAIEVGQVLRIAPPAGSAAAAGSSSAGAGGSAKSDAGAQASSQNKAGPGVTLVWPAQGSIIRGFDGKNSKGIDIANVAGTPVVAAATGSVVYAGNGLRGYGNMLIVKHDSEYLTAYAHNRALLVKEGQTVTQGQQIAEMGDTDSNRVMLHFELRYLGRSTDPSRYLPPR